MLVLDRFYVLGPELVTACRVATPLHVRHGHMVGVSRVTSHPGQVSMVGDQHLPVRLAQVLDKLVSGSCPHNISQKT